MLENGIMEKETINGGQIKEARHGNVSSLRGARDTAADVVFYNADDSGLEFKNKFIEKEYNKAKKRYSRKQKQLEEEQKILENPKEHFPEYVNLKREQALKQEIAPIFLITNPWTIGAVATSAAVSVPAALVGTAGGTIGGVVGSNIGSKLDTNRHGYTDNATVYGLIGGTIAGGTGAGIGSAGERFVANKGYNWLTHNVKNIGRGFSDYFKYGKKSYKNVIYDNGLKRVSKEQLLSTQTLPSKQSVWLTDDIAGNFTKSEEVNVPVIKMVFNTKNAGYISAKPLIGQVDYSIAAPNKSASRWVYQNISNVIKPGDYIGNDNSTSPLGNRLRISKTVSNNPVEFVKSMSALAKIENKPTQTGYSPDAYAQILKIGTNPKKPFTIRYAIDPDTKFNNMGKSVLADEITYKQDWNLYNEKLVQDYVDFVNNNLIKPNGGDPGWIGLDGIPRFPHPYLMRK